MEVSRNMKGFEGDRYLLAEVKRLIDFYEIDIAIETGTFHGGTTRQLARMAPEVITCELMPENHSVASQNLARFDNVTMHLGNSAELLLSILPEVKGKNVLLYLDAHWYDYCPLIDELKAIAQAGLQPVIVIHDWKVPGRQDLGYDSYNGQDYEYEWIRHELDAIYGRKNYFYYYNSPAEEGMRGVIFIIPNWRRHEDVPNLVVESHARIAEALTAEEEDALGHASGGSDPYEHFNANTHNSSYRNDYSGMGGRYP